MDQIEKILFMKSFLTAYEDKNLDLISGFLAQDIVLRDWNLEVSGKNAALAEFAKNFDSAQTISILVKQIHTSERAVAAEIEIEVDGNEQLRVVDVITFDDDSKVASIVSYKGL